MFSFSNSVSVSVSVSVSSQQQFDSEQVASSEQASAPATVFRRLERRQAAALLALRRRSSAMKLAGAINDKSANVFSVCGGNNKWVPLVALVLLVPVVYPRSGSVLGAICLAALFNLSTR